MAMKVGLVQINNELRGRAYHPYAVGCLQAYAFAHLKDPFVYEFSIPIFERIPVRDAVARLVNSDLVAFSSYVWNEQLQLEIARTLKKLRPSIGIVFGGPQVPHPFDEEKPWIPNRAEEYIRQNPYIDILCHGEGERLFVSLLENANGDWNEIPSVSFLRSERYVQTPRDERLLDFSILPSPYLSGIFDPLMEEYPKMQWNGLYETNRGCPYRCKFCGWGGPVNKKPIPFPMERVLQELEWFGKNRVWRIWCCDANFGIFTRDFEIARYAVKVKEDYGCPEIFYLQSAKNFAERMYDIHTTLHSAGMNQIIVLAFQSTDEDTLANVDRKNIRPEFYRSIQARAKRDKIPTSTDLIIPLPGETFDSFVNGVCEVIENGGIAQVNPLSITPDAEMCDPAYQQKFGMEMVEARVMNLHGAVADKGISHVSVQPLPRENFSSDAEWIQSSVRETGEELYEKEVLVVGTASMPSKDWVRAKVFSWMTLLVYFNRLLIIPLVVLHKAFGFKYQELLTLLSDTEFDPLQYPVLTGIRSLFWEKAREIQSGGYELSVYNGTWWPANEYAMVSLVNEGKFDGFYREAEGVLSAYTEESDVDVPSGFLKEAILLNRELLKLPERTSDFDFEFSYNIGEFFTGVLEMQEVPLEKKPHRYRADRTSTRWDFNWWCTEVVDKGHKGSRYLYDFEEVRDV